MGEEHSIQSIEGSDNRRRGAKKLVGSYWGRNVGTAKRRLEWNRDLILEEYVPGTVSDRYEKDGEWGEFDSDIEKRWGDIERGLQEAEHASRWISKTLPDVLVVWEDFQPHGVGLVEAANDLSIPTVMVAHGAVYGSKPGNFGNRTCAKYLCGTWAIKQMYKDFDQEIEVIPTGLPDGDVFVKMDSARARVANRKDLGWDENSPVITYVGTWSGNRTHWQPDEQLYFGAFLQAFKVLRELQPTVQLNVCPHPNSPIPLEWYKKVLEGNGIDKNYRVLPEGTDLWILGSDLLVGVQSSVMVTGLMAGIPSVIMQFWPWHERAWFQGKGFEIVESVRELTERLAMLFSGTSRYVTRKLETKKGAEWFASNPDGKASKRVARVISRLAKGDKPDELCYAAVPNE